MGDAAPRAGDAAEPEAWPADAVEVGRIVDAWGVKGWIKVDPHAADPQALLQSKLWFLQRETALPVATLHVTRARGHGGAVVAAVREIADRTSAEALRGARVHVSRASFPKPASDEYYWVDLIGLAVINREGVALGTVADLIDNGAHAVLRVAFPRPDSPPGERLIPFVSAYVDDVDLQARQIRVDWAPDY